METTAEGDAPGSPPASIRSSSVSSSTTSPFSSSRVESFDFTGYPPLSEYEEFPSYRWLRSSSREAESWSEGYIPLCRHKKESGGGVFPFKDARGEKCLFVPAGGLVVGDDEDQLWSCTDTIRHGQHSWHAVQLMAGFHLDIRGTIDTATLSSGREHAVYLLFRFGNESFGFVLQEVSLEIGANSSKQNICLEPGYRFAEYNEANIPNEAVNGWKSIEMGRFSTGRSENMKLLISFTEGRRQDPGRQIDDVIAPKEGLIIGGVIVEPTLMDHNPKGLLNRVISLVR